MNFLRKIFKNKPKIEPTIESIELGVFQTLPFECLLEIVSYLSLPECMFLRSSSYHLKTAVDYHFRTSIRTLPVLLSARYSPEKCSRFNEISKDYDCETLTFGSTSGYCHRELVEEKGMFFSMEGKDHFRLEDYLVLFNMAKFGSFVNFITEYLPKITKLALVIDHDDHMKHIPEVLNVYRNQLEVLLLEKTLRSNELKVENDWNFEKTIHLPVEIYHSVDSLEALEELYFFAKPANMNRFPREHTNGETRKRFMKSMCQKLRVVHIAMICDFFKWEYERNLKVETYKNLEELCCYSFDVHTYLRHFPKLQKCILSSIGEPDLRSLNWDLLPNLRELRLNCSVTDLERLPRSRIRLEDIDSPNLERIHCRGICWRMSDLTDVEPNRTIREIEIDMFRPYSRWEESTDEEELKGLLECLTYFINLEKLIIREPSMVLTWSELRSF